MQRCKNMNKINTESHYLIIMLYSVYQGQKMSKATMILIKDICCLKSCLMSFTCFTY